MGVVLENVVVVAATVVAQWAASPLLTYAQIDTIVEKVGLRATAQQREPL